MSQIIAHKPDDVADLTFAAKRWFAMSKKSMNGNLICGVGKTPEEAVTDMRNLESKETCDAL